jgi:hypothetical protein
MFDFKKLIEDANAIDVLDPRYRIIAEGFVKGDRKREIEIQEEHRREVSRLRSGQRPRSNAERFKGTR